MKNEPNWFIMFQYVGKRSSQLQVISGDALVLLTLKFVPQVLRRGCLEFGAFVEGIPSQLMDRQNPTPVNASIRQWQLS